MKKPINILIPIPKKPATSRIYAIVIAVSKCSNTEATIIDSSERRIPQKLVVNIYRPSNVYDERKVIVKNVSFSQSDCLTLSPFINLNSLQFLQGKR